MNLSQIEYFLELVRYKSFKKAAEGMYISQPALSQQISSLEKEWGMKLFVRKYKEVELTPSGKIMYEMLNNAKEEFHTAVSKAQNAVSDLKTILSIGVPELCNLANLPEILTDFQNSHPNLLLNIESRPIDQLTLPKNNNHFDLVINQEYLLMNRKDISTRFLANRRHMLFISRKHPAVKGKDTFDFSDLDGLRLYLPGNHPDDYANDYTKLNCASSGFSPGQFVYQPNVHSVLLATKMCFGGTILDDLIRVPQDYDLLGIPTAAQINWLLAWKPENNQIYLMELVDTIAENMQW